MLRKILDWIRGRKNKKGNRKPDPLLSACMGDHRKAQRLIDHEQRRDPGITANEARQRAVQRIERDRG